MTESAAITLYLGDRAGADGLTPRFDEEARPEFLRWLVFLVANLYPTFTYADDPARFVTGVEAQGAFRDAVDRYGERLWTVIEQAAGQPWFLGARFSALDIYVAAMTHWRPRRAWIAAHCPNISAIALRTDAVPSLAPVWQRNFDGYEE
jgi:GST-like protein